MSAEKAALAEFRVGTYVCPRTSSPVPLMATCSTPFLKWPVVVEKCSACGETHTLRSEDVEHPPTFGYE